MRFAAPALLLLAACAGAPPARRLPAADAGPRRTVIGNSVEGRPIEALWLGAGRETVLLLASIHGNESAGTALLERLATRLGTDRALLRDRRVLLVPTANPDGVARRTRGNARGVDLNRNFPASNRLDRRRHGTALSEPESAALQRLIDTCRPVRVVSLHEPRACIDYDGPAEPLARAMAAACGLPVQRLGSRPGSLGSSLGLDRGVPIVTMELPAGAAGMDAEELWRRYGSALVAAVSFSLK